MRRDEAIGVGNASRCIRGGNCFVSSHGFEKNASRNRFSFNSHGENLLTVGYEMRCEIERIKNVLSVSRLIPRSTVRRIALFMSVEFRAVNSWRQPQ